jgi:1-acyl-sn-glycerol-3-phosphate acyltransferase
MAHPVSFNSWPARIWLLEAGAIPSTYDAALAALRANVPVIVFPGGDLDASRPIWLANRVVFGNRVGFLKIARTANVPIVPLGIRGSHFTAPVLFRSQWLGRALILPWLLGLKRFPVTLLGVLVALVIALVAAPRIGPWWTTAIVWLWISLPLSHLPWIPWRVRLRLGPAIAPRELFGDASDESLEKAQRIVVSAIEALVGRGEQAT